MLKLHDGPTDLNVNIKRGCCTCPVDDITMSVPINQVSNERL